jgi:hypothetical protein
MWIIEFCDAFEPEFDGLTETVQDAIYAVLKLLEMEGPSLGRPHADTLKGSFYPNMKELRVKADGGVWRIAYAFDPQRNGILLVAGDKAGKAQQRFYKTLIATADRRYRDHLK